MAIESLVVDDEPLARDLLAGYVKQTPFLHFAGACSSAVEALTVLQLLVMLALLAACTAFLVDGSFNPFLYFRF